jgi:hypothetical protein
MLVRVLSRDTSRSTAQVCAGGTLAQCDPFGRVTYEMMEEAWRGPAQPGTRPDWMEPFARTIDAAKKYVVSST